MPFTEDCGIALVGVNSEYPKYTGDVTMQYYSLSYQRVVVASAA